MEFSAYLKPSSGTLVANEESDWLKTVAKVTPVLQGVGAVAALVMGIVKAQQEATFQAELLGTLKSIQTELTAIKEQLNKIYDQLKKIEQAIRGLELNEKLTAISSWTEMSLALDPKDTAGTARLAAAMLNPQPGASNLPSCMTGLHDALMGNNIGTPLMEMVGPVGFLRIRTRLMQGLHLLAFACACNREMKLDFGVYLLNWARNLAAQNRKYFEIFKDSIPKPDLGGLSLKTSDHVVVYDLTCPLQEGVELVFQGRQKRLPVFSGTLVSGLLEGEKETQLVFADAPEDRFGFVDLEGDRSTIDYQEPWTKDCDPFRNPKRWCLTRVGGVVSGISPETVAERATLAAAARFHPAQTFLGAVDGQRAWLEATGERSTYTCCIRDGAAKTSPLLRWSDDGKSVSSVSMDALTSLLPTLWTVSQISKDVIRIMRSSPAEPAAYLTLEGGAWAVTQNQQNSSLRITVPDDEIRPMPLNPLTLPPVSARISRDGATGSKTVLFHRM